jgi:hypothetical protein
MLSLSSSASNSELACTKDKTYFHAHDTRHTNSRCAEVVQRTGDRTGPHHSHCPYRPPLPTEVPTRPTIHHRGSHTTQAHCTSCRGDDARCKQHKHTHTHTHTHTTHKGQGCDLMFVACTEYLIILTKRTVLMSRSQPRGISSQGITTNKHNTRTHTHTLTHTRERL